MMEFAAPPLVARTATFSPVPRRSWILLKAAIHADDWPRFRHGEENRAQVERDLMPIVVQVFTQQTERPTSAALRLLGWAQENQAEVRGRLLLAGRQAAREAGPSGSRADGHDGRGRPFGGLGLADVCDLAYVLLLDKWERQALADRQALIARGVDEGLPTLAETQQRLNEALTAEPKPVVVAVDDEQMELRRALGVA
jgi:hypothetical protein